METRIPSASSRLSSDCMFLSVARMKELDRASIHFERPSNMEGENKNYVLAEAKQSIFNSRPQRKIHELLSMATSRFCHVCCLHSLLLPFFFSLCSPSAPTVLAQVLPALLSTRPGICRQAIALLPGVCTSPVFPLAAVLVTPGLCMWDSDFPFQEWLPGIKQTSCFLSYTLPLLFFPLKLKVKATSPP